MLIKATIPQVHVFCNHYIIGRLKNGISTGITPNAPYRKLLSQHWELSLPWFKKYSFPGWGTIFEKLDFILKPKSLKRFLKLFKKDFWSRINHYLVEDSMDNHWKLRWISGATKSHCAKVSWVNEQNGYQWRKKKVEEKDITDAMCQINNFYFIPQRKTKTAKLKMPLSSLS